MCDRREKRTLNLGLLSGRVSRTAIGGGSSATSSGSGTTAGTDVQEQVLDILALKSLSNIRNCILVCSVHSRVRTLAKREVQMGSTSSIFAALIRDWSLSACEY
jgi:hypothetical protein